MVLVDPDAVEAEPICKFEFVEVAVIERMPLTGS